MRISRLYVRCALRAGERIDLDPEAAHYLRTVLRLRRGDELVVFRGDGADFPAVVDQVSKERVSVSLGDPWHPATESPLSIRLGLGISRGERMDLALQKAVELGVAAITPLFTQHCVVRLDADRLEGRCQHWRGVIQSACEQSGRSRIPALERPRELSEWLTGAEGLKLCFDPLGDRCLRELPPPAGPVSVLSGPEGGFAEAERTLISRRGFIPVRLGPRILRAETAVLAALAVIQAEWGDFGWGQQGPEGPGAGRLPVP